MEGYLRQTGKLPQPILGNKAIFFYRLVGIRGRSCESQVYRASGLSLFESIVLIRVNRIGS